MPEPDKNAKQERAPEKFEVRQLRDAHYNATVLERIDVHPDLMRIRVRPDDGFTPFSPGQYVALGLGYWEPRVPDSQPEDLEPSKCWTMVRRAYSISSAMFDSDANLITCNECEFLEFYIALIRYSDAPPALTPRLFLLQPGDRLFVQPRICGNYTLHHVSPEDDILFLATGTGEAPHNAMTASLLKNGHYGKIVSATCARFDRDFGYIREHELLAGRFPNYAYLRYTTREPRNLDPKLDTYIGPQRFQKIFTSGQLARDSGLSFAPERTHVYLCGNPQMIGIQKPGTETVQAPESSERGMLQLLLEKGFRDHAPPGPGYVAYEKYW